MTRFYFLHRLTVCAVFLCMTPADGYVVQGMYDCEYSDNMTDMVFLVKNVLNQRLCTIYDSRVGKYVGYGEHCMKDAYHYNHVATYKLPLRRSQLETICKYNAKLFRRSTLDRKLPPIVKVHQTKPADYGERSVLECSLWGFFPQEVRVSWLRDGVEVNTDVSSTDVMANGDWSFQLHSYLEYTPTRGERVTCRVEHSSLKESLEVDWDSSPLDAKHMKKAVGIIFFIVGLVVAAGGAVYYRWKQRSDFSPVAQHRQTSFQFWKF